MTFSEQFGLFPEGGHQFWAAAHPAQAAPPQGPEFGQIFGAQVS
jgi:hypothetical protein